MEERTLTAKQAVEHLLDLGMSKYAIAKKLSISGNMPNNYLNGAQMRPPTASLFKQVFNITIKDVYEAPSVSERIS